MYCTSCGNKNHEGAKFCAFCGASLAVADDTTVILPVTEADDFDDETTDPFEDLAPKQGAVIVKRGPNAGSRFLLDKDITSAGRNPDSDIFLNDVTVSRRHVEIHREGDAYLLKDTGSLNGSYVNRERVEVAQLASGDEIQIGKYKLTFYQAPGE